jgi:hypothetical protein
MMPVILPFCSTITEPIFSSFILEAHSKILASGVIVTGILVIASITFNPDFIISPLKKKEYFSNINNLPKKELVG